MELKVDMFMAKETFNTVVKINLLTFDLKAVMKLIYLNILGSWYQNKSTC